MVGVTSQLDSENVLDVAEVADVADVAVVCWVDDDSGSCG
jgi:hypothetical protein